MYSYFNPNPQRKRTGDCVVRALCKVFDADWHTVFRWLCMQADSMCEMPSGNSVWGAFLRKRGFKRAVIPNNCEDCYTVEDFCQEHPFGTYVLALRGHVCTIIDGIVYDSWDSRYEIPLYFWHKKEEE